MDILLIAGMWLDGRAWEGVLPPLEAAGHRPVPLTLPGQGSGGDATLDDQLDSVLAAVDASAEPVMVVGHSAAATLAWLAADRRPDQVASVVLVGGFPEVYAKPYFPVFAPVDGQVRFPGWEPFTGPDSEDLDAEMRAHVESIAVPVAEGVTTAPVHYTGPRRFDVPVTIICPEFSPEEAQQWVGAGDVPELGNANRVEFVDLESGHWPMFSRPAELARAILDAVPQGEPVMLPHREH